MVFLIITLIALLYLFIGATIAYFSTSLCSSKSEQLEFISLSKRKRILFFFDMIFKWPIFLVTYIILN